MKTIENKKVTIPGDVKDYADLITHCVNIVPEGGFTIDEMGKRFRIIEVLKKKGASLKIEDADFVCAKKCILAMKWPSLNKTVYDFVNYIKSIK